MAPQLTPMAWAMKATGEFTWMMAMTAEIAMKTTIRERMISSCFFSSIFRMTCPFSRSRVTVEEEVSTRELRVLMEADRTRMMTTAISRSGRPESIAGMTASKPPTGFPFSATPMMSENSRPKPPRK